LLNVIAIKYIKILADNYIGLLNSKLDSNSFTRFGTKEPRQVK